MAFKDITRYLYPDEQGRATIKLDYKDKAHRYCIRRRKNFDLPEDNPKAWDKAERPSGTTTLLGDTLEKKGLMTWPLNMAMSELFGFYNFTTDEGELMQGFSEEKELDEKTGQLVKTGRLKGTMFDADRNIIQVPSEELFGIVDSANRAWQRRQKKGADIGSVVHDSIEHYVRKDRGSEEDAGYELLDIPAVYRQLIETSEYETEADRDVALAAIEEDAKKAQLAFDKFVEWWTKEKPTLVGAEELVYSKRFHVSGTFDGLIRINGKLVLADWKTSNASTSLNAAMPEGINYQYYIQSAIYAMIWEEMGGEPIDDLLIVSARKDGGFTPLFASDLDLTMEDLVNWVRAVIICYRMAEKTKGGLLQRGFDLGLLKDPKAKKEKK
jgi:hypothetical protein